MQQKPKKRRKRLRRFIPRILVITIITLYFLSRVFPILGTTSQKTVIAQYGTVEVIVSTTGIIARDEKILANGGDGEVKYFVDEGEKVAKGQKLAELYLEKLDEKYVQELEIINLRIQSINEKQEEGSLFQRDLDKIDSEINTLFRKMQQDIKNNNYEKVEQYKAELQDLSNKKSIIIGEDSFSGKNLLQLEEQKASLEKKLKTSFQTIYSETPGFVTFGSDGLEDVINLNTIDHFTSSDIERIKKDHLNPKEPQSNQNVLRMVNNYRWSIVFDLEEKEAEGLQAGKNIMVRKQGEDRDYTARVRRIEEDGDKRIVILDLTEALEGLYHLRTMQIDIVKNRYQGAMIPNEAIIEQEGSIGVYRTDVNGFVKFIPIKVKGSNREYSIVHDGTFEKINEETKTSKLLNTINLYDEIVLNGKNVSEGQKIR